MGQRDNLIGDITPGFPRKPLPQPLHLDNFVNFLVKHTNLSDGSLKNTYDVSKYRCNDKFFPFTLSFTSITTYTVHVLISFLTSR